MLRVGLLTIVMAFAASPGLASDIKLPKQITPQICVACESDVRRLCIRPNSTQFSVKICVLANIGRLNATCRKRLASAGLI
jgi:hypothetical protein